MSTADSVKTELAGLLTKANAATGNADTTLHDAVYALVEGYGQGGGSATVYIGAAEPDSSVGANGDIYIVRG